MSFATRMVSRAAGALALGALTLGATAARADDTIKIGILHSLSGTMAISETTLKDVMLMLIDEQNKKGGVLGKKLEAVVVDPASNWPLSRRASARQAPAPPPRAKPFVLQRTWVTS